MVLIPEYQKGCKNEQLKVESKVPGMIEASFNVGHIPREKIVYEKEICPSEPSTRRQKFFPLVPKLRAKAQMNEGIIEDAA